jgi:hypothetical protein
MQCDGKLPACTQCLRSGRGCAGYRQDLILVHHEFTQTGAILHFERAAEPATIRGDEYTHIQPAISDHNSRNMASMTGMDLRTNVQSITSHSIGASAALILSNYIPACEKYPTHCNTSQVCGSWAKLLPNVSTEDNQGGVLSSTMTTLSVSIWTKDAGGRLPTHECIQSYTSALSLLRHSLLETGCSFCAEIVAASMCLALTEVCSN